MPNVLTTPTDTDSGFERPSCGIRHFQPGTSEGLRPLSAIGWTQFDELPLQRGGDGGGAIVHAQLAEDPAQVGLHRRLGHAQPVGDVAVGRRLRPVADTMRPPLD